MEERMRRLQGSLWLLLDLVDAALKAPRQVGASSAPSHDVRELLVDVERGVEDQVADLMRQGAPIARRRAVEDRLRDPDRRLAGIHQVGRSQDARRQTVGGLRFQFVMSPEKIFFQIYWLCGLGQALDLPQFIAGRFFNVLPRKMVSLRQDAIGDVITTHFLWFFRLRFGCERRGGRNRTVFPQSLLNFLW